MSAPRDHPPPPTPGPSALEPRMPLHPPTTRAVGEGRHHHLQRLERPVPVVQRPPNNRGTEPDYVRPARPPPPAYPRPVRPGTADASPPANHPRCRRSSAPPSAAAGTSRPRCSAPPEQPRHRTRLCPPRATTPPRLPPARPPWNRGCLSTRQPPAL